jgi:MtN3 and saliva related transmembrane protein
MSDNAHRSLLILKTAYTQLAFCTLPALVHVRKLKPEGGSVSIEFLGWASSCVLLLTLMRQVYTQWKTRSTAGVSKWLFIGQLAASVGYTVYSYLLHNWVFLTSNIAILGTALLGEALYLRNRRLKDGRVDNDDGASSARA